MIVKYKERLFIDRFKAIDSIKELHAVGKFEQGGLVYYKINAFSYIAIAKEFVISEK